MPAAPARFNPAIRLRRQRARADGVAGHGPGEQNEAGQFDARPVYPTPMRISNAKEALGPLSLAIWLAVSLASLAAMYHLWWSRERVLYVGKNAAEQRAVVFKRAGMNASILTAAQRADAAWPLDATYAASRSGGKLAYLNYLLIPRMPSGSDVHLVKQIDDTYAITPANGAAPPHPPFMTIHPTPRGLTLSALVLLAIALGLSRFGLTIPEGAACAAILLCVATLALKAMFHTYAPVGVFLCAVGVAGAWLAWKRRSPTTQVDAHPVAACGIWDRLGRGGIVAVLLGGIIWAFLMAVVVVPDDWDAWAIWGAKAKTLLLGTGALSEVTPFGHPDYPLVWPAVWAFSGWCAGGWEEQWSKGWSVLFMLLAAWQAGRLAADLSGRRGAGMLVAALFVSMPAVPLIASWSYAEPALWLMLVCAFRRLVRWDAAGRTADAVWAGVFAAGAALTKNEGLLFAALALLWMMPARTTSKWRGLGASTAAFILLYAPWVFWIRFGAGLTPGKSVGMREGAFASVFERSLESLGLIARMWADVRQWNVVLPAGLAFALYLGIRRWRTFPRLAFIPLAMWLGTLAVMLLRPDALDWQIGTAWNRITLQSFVLLLPALAAGFAEKKTRAQD